MVNKILNKYRYNFEIEFVGINEKNHTDSENIHTTQSQRKIDENKIKTLIGIPISVIHIDDISGGMRYQNYAIVRGQALAKASEIVASTVGLKYGGEFKHNLKKPQPYHVSGMDLYGQLANVKLISVEEIE